MERVTRTKPHPRVDAMRHAGLSTARRLAVARPKLSGRRSSSTVLSEVCLGLPVLHRQSLGGPQMQARRAREWSILRLNSPVRTSLVTYKVTLWRNSAHDPRAGRRREWASSVNFVVQRITTNRINGVWPLQHIHVIHTVHTLPKEQIWSKQWSLVFTHGKTNCCCMRCLYKKQKNLQKRSKISNYILKTAEIGDKNTEKETSRTTDLQ